MNKALSLLLLLILGASLLAQNQEAYKLDLMKDTKGHPSNRYLVLLEIQENGDGRTVDTLVHFMSGVKIIDYHIHSKDSLAIVFTLSDERRAEYFLLTYNHDDGNYYANRKVVIGEMTLRNVSRTAPRITRKEFKLLDLYRITYEQQLKKSERFVYKEADMRHDVYEMLYNLYLKPPE